LWSSFCRGRGMLDAIPAALEELLRLDVIVALVAGGVLGYVVGAIPGLNAVTASILALPILITLPTLPAIAFIAAMYGASETGGAVPAILFNVPGTPGAGATAIEGHEMAKRGEASL